MISKGVRTREFTMADYDPVIALWDEADGVEVSLGDSREEIERYLQRNPGLSRVAEEAAVIVGAALCGHDGRRGWIYHLAVKPEGRGRGIAKLLVDDCVRGLHETGIRRVIILVAGDNPGAHAFWSRNGWEEIAGAVAMSRDL